MYSGSMIANVFCQNRRGRMITVQYLMLITPFTQNPACCSFPQLTTLFSWYAALLILWIRRPWYDTSWGENDSMSLNEEEEEDEEEEVRLFVVVVVVVVCERNRDILPMERDSR